MTLRVLALLVLVGVLGWSPPHAVAASDLHRVLGLPLINRDASQGPGGVHPTLPYDRNELARLLNEARRQGVAPRRYAALLYQYWLVDATSKAGIDLRSWNPRTGVEANRANLTKSYRYYENLQLAHRELQWAGMAGQVGADFGGGLLDFEMVTNIYGLGGLSEAARAVLGAVGQAAGPQVVAQLPRGLAALADAGSRITPEDLRHIIGMILVMQKNIFSDLMPMHDAYVTAGLPAVQEFQAAGLIDAGVMRAWRDVASGNPNRIAAGNAALLRREQQWAIGRQWDEVRAYKGSVGEAITYASGAAGSPSVAGVIPPREFRRVTRKIITADGRPATLALPLPDWNWSVLDQRWAYITSELLPKYKDQVNNNWPGLAMVMRTPYEVQMETHRPIMNIPQLLESAARGVTIIPDAAGVGAGGR